MFYNIIIFYDEYLKILITFLFVFFLCMILIGIPYIFSLSIFKDKQKLSEYECGFEPFDNSTRLPFDVHFYIIGILFLIFDVEIIILFPWIFNLKLISWLGFYTIYFFILILIIGYVYEWRSDILKI